MSRAVKWRHGPWSRALAVGCRLAGWVTALLLLRLELARGLESSPLLAVLEVVLAGITALLIGNVVKEFAFALSELVLTACGRAVARKTVTLSGRRVAEIWFPGGTWIRNETWRGGAAWEWTERDGSCTRIESPTMTVRRTTPAISSSQDCVTAIRT